MDYAELIRHLNAELGRQGDAWEMRAYELVRARLHQPEEFLHWAMHDHHWSFTMAEVMTSNPIPTAELARRLLVTILGELREERAVFAGEV
jgi:hypothetical protein